MKIYNTLTKQIEEFIPHNKECITMYTCGPTVYYYAHIGNLRTYISEDILEKSLNYLGYKVKRCMNITDVGHLVGDGDTGEDKMTKAAKKEHKSALEIAQFYTDAFFEDLKKLNIKKPEIISKATDNIDFYIKMIEKLLKEDIAYKSNGNIYFDTNKYKDYYKLSGRNKDDLITAVREDVEEDKNKKNPFDFGLWFTNSKFDNQELKWDSPFGRGYPGWHIECSAIAIKNLGEYLDIHCGAVDAIFPHHTNEIAQSEAYLNHKWCNYWIHGEFLNDKNGKMSKSKGDSLDLRKIEKKYNPLVYRYFCLTSHYRNKLDYSDEALKNSEIAYNKLLNKIKLLNDNKKNIDNEIVNKYINIFKEAIENDLNTSNMLKTVYDVLKEKTNDETKIFLLKEFDKVLSLDFFKETKIDKELLKYIEEKIEERKQAQINKNYEKADQIREELKQENIILKDTREGTTFEVKNG